MIMRPEYKRIGPGGPTVLVLEDERILLQWRTVSRKENSLDPSDSEIAPRLWNSNETAFCRLATSSKS